MRIYAYLLAVMLATGDALASDLFKCHDAAHDGGTRITANPISVPESCHAWELVYAGITPDRPGQSREARERQIRRDVRECNQYYESGACLFSKGYREGYE